MRFTIQASLLLIVCCVSNATTWGKSTVKDPVNGKDCIVSEPMSSGSYIYQWPSKYDGVYWPFTDTNWIWHCPDSGFTSFGDDFEKLTPDEVVSVRSYLEANYKKPSSAIGIDAKLWLLESIYKLRTKDNAFWGWFKRVKATIYEDLAAVERYDAKPLLEAEIQQLEPSFDLVQKLYVLGDYYRREGEEDKAEELFQKALSVKWISKDGNDVTGSPYIEEIINERRALMRKSKK